MSGGTNVHFDNSAVVQNNNTMKNTNHQISQENYEDDSSFFKDVKQRNTVYGTGFFDQRNQRTTKINKMRDSSGKVTDITNQGGAGVNNNSGVNAMQ